jgi:predicted site-specific integrase-resolvase
LRSRYPGYAIIEDIGSGLNNKRHGFRTILEQLFKGNVKHVVVAHTDRFSRLGFDFFEWMFGQFGAVLESVEKAETDTGNELVEDVMEVLTVFTARYYGKRKYAGDKENKDSSFKEAKRVISKVH